MLFATNKIISLYTLTFSNLQRITNVKNKVLYYKSPKIPSFFLLSRPIMVIFYI